MKKIKILFIFFLIGSFFISSCQLPSIIKPSYKFKVKEININLGENPEFIDPKFAFGYGQQIDELIFLELTEIDDQTGELIPELANDWEMSEDGLTWTFNLRNDVYWVKYDEDNNKIEKIRPVNAYDVECAIKRVLTPPNLVYPENLIIIKGAEKIQSEYYKSPKKLKGELIDNLGVKALDDYTIQFSLEEPAIFFPVLLSYPIASPLPKELVQLSYELEGKQTDRVFIVCTPEKCTTKDIYDEGKKWTYVKNIITNGPYVIKEGDLDNKIVLEKNPYYFDADNVSIDRINWFIIKDYSIALDMYSDNIIDVLKIPEDEVENIISNPELSEQLKIIPTLCTYYYGFITKKPPFDNPLVRKAFSLAIDRKSLLKKLFKWEGCPANRLINPFRLNIKIDDKEAEIKYDIEKAKELLSEAGYPDGKDFPEIILMTFKKEENVANAMKEMLQNYLGVDIKIDYLKFGSKKFEDIFEGNLPIEELPHILRLGWCADYLDFHGYFKGFIGEGYVKNLLNWENNEFEDLIDDAKKERDSEKRRNLYEQAEKILINKDAVIIPIYYYVKFILTKPYIKRSFSKTGLESIDKWDITQEPQRKDISKYEERITKAKQEESTVEIEEPTPEFETPTLPESCPEPTKLSSLLTPIPFPPEVYINDYKKNMRFDSKEEIDELFFLPHYDMTIKIDLENNVLIGKEKTSFENREDRSLNNIILRLYPNVPEAPNCECQDNLYISKILIDDKEIDFNYNALNSSINIELEKPIEVGEKISLEIDFNLRISSSKNKVYSFSSFYPMLAVYDERGWRKDVKPCMMADKVYSESAFYNVELIAPNDMIIASSGIEVNKIINKDNTITYHYIAGPIRDFSISMSPDYKVISKEVDDIKINCYYMQEDEENSKKILECAANSVKTFNQYLGYYPYNELDIMVHSIETAPQGALAGIEYPSLIYIIHGPNVEETSLEFTIAHEIAHQWFYSVIGNDILYEPWLDEAFANYCAVIYFEKIYGKSLADNVYEEKINYQYQRAVREDLGDLPINLSVWDFSETGLYLPIIYGKGAIFLDTLRKEIGDDSFFKTLNEYYEDYKYEVVTGKDFLDKVEEVSGKELNEFYDDWFKK